MSALDEATVQARLAEVPGWGVVDGALHRTFEFADFAEAFAFMTRVALVAEKLDHHPDWSNSWNRVEIAVVSHSAGGITDQCFGFATRVNAFADA